jgi:integrase
MALTDTAIKALKRRSTRYVVTDGQGLILEVHPTGNMTWRYRYRLKGKAEKASIGRYPDISLKAARQKRNELAALVAREQSPAQEKQRAKQALSANTTVKEFGERYFLDIASRDIKEPKHIRRYLDKEIYPELGAKAMCDVSIADVQRIVFRKKDSGREAAAAAIRNLLKRLFDYAVARQVTATNPALALPMRFITKPKARERNLSPDEIRVYLQTLYRSNICRQFKLGLHLILLTMARKGELLAAKWSDVDFESAEWHVPVENSKTGKPHIVTCPHRRLGFSVSCRFLPAVRSL